jgi:hypothetical protein
MSATLLVGHARVKAAEPRAGGAPALSWKRRAAAARDPAGVVILAVDVEAAMHEAGAVQVEFS